MRHRGQDRLKISWRLKWYVDLVLIISMYMSHLSCSLSASSSSHILILLYLFLFSPVLRQKWTRKCNHVACTHTRTRYKSRGWAHTETPFFANWVWPQSSLCFEHRSISLSDKYRPKYQCPSSWSQLPPWPSSTTTSSSSSDHAHQSRRQPTGWFDLFNTYTKCVCSILRCTPSY